MEGGTPLGLDMQRAAALSRPEWVRQPLERSLMAYSHERAYQEGNAQRALLNVAHGALPDAPCMNLVLAHYAAGLAGVHPPSSQMAADAILRGEGRPLVVESVGWTPDESGYDEALASGELPAVEALRAPRRPSYAQEREAAMTVGERVLTGEEQDEQDRRSDMWRTTAERVAVNARGLLYQEDMAQAHQRGEGFRQTREEGIGVRQALRAIPLPGEQGSVRGGLQLVGDHASILRAAAAAGHAPAANLLASASGARPRLRSRSRDGSAEFRDARERDQHRGVRRSRSPGRRSPDRRRTR